MPETFRRTVEEAIIPGLATFGIDAEQAWRARSLDFEAASDLGASRSGPSR